MMEWYHVLTVIVSFLTLFWLIKQEVKEARKETKQDIKDLSTKMDVKFEKIDARSENLEKQIHEIKNDMIEIKTILRLRECCMIQDQNKLPKAE